MPAVSKFASVLTPSAITIFLSSILNVVELIVVVEPLTVRLPATVKLPEVSQDGPPVDNFIGVTVRSAGVPTSTILPYDIIKQLVLTRGATAKIIVL